MNKLEQSQNQVPHSDLDRVCNALAALLGSDLTESQLKERLIKDNIAGNIDLQDRLHDYLMEHGKEINTVEQLEELLKKIPNL